MQRSNFQDAEGIASEGVEEMGTEEGYPPLQPTTGLESVVSSPAVPAENDFMAFSTVTERLPLQCLPQFYVNHHHHH